MSKEVARLSAWLRRIEEACGLNTSSSRHRDIREAALAALRGEAAPAGKGLPQMFRAGDRVASVAYEKCGLVLARDGRQVWVRFNDGQRLTVMASDLVLEEEQGGGE